jgi:hypothetical protein
VAPELLTLQPKRSGTMGPGISQNSVAKVNNKKLPPYPLTAKIFFILWVALLFFLGFFNLEIERLSDAGFGLLWNQVIAGRVPS